MGRDPGCSPYKQAVLTIMKSITTTMLNMLQRLAEMFPDGSYQARLDAYLNSHGIIDSM